MPKRPPSTATAIISPFEFVVCTVTFLDSDVAEAAAKGVVEEVEGTGIEDEDKDVDCKVVDDVRREVGLLLKVGKELSETVGVLSILDDICGVVMVPTVLGVVVLVMLLVIDVDLVGPCRRSILNNL